MTTLFPSIEQRQRRKERRAAIQTDQVVKNLAAEWHHFWIINIPNNQWHMYLQCQNHSLPSKYSHCRLIRKEIKIVFIKELAIFLFKFVRLYRYLMCLQASWRVLWQSDGRHNPWNILSTGSHAWRAVLCFISMA